MLREDPARSSRAISLPTARDFWNNRIICGDNLTVLQILQAPADLQHADAICGKFVFTRVQEMCQREPESQLNETWLQENAWRIVRTCATTAVAKCLADHRRTSLTPCVSVFTVETSQNKLYMMKRDYDDRHAQPRIRLLFADDYLTVHPGDFWQDIKTTGLGDESGVDFTHGKKPEALLKRIIGMITQPGDCVLDAWVQALPVRWSTRWGGSGS